MNNINVLTKYFPLMIIIYLIIFLFYYYAQTSIYVYQIKLLKDILLT